MHWRFWKYLSPAEKTKYVILGLIGAVVGVGAVVLGVMGKISGEMAIMTVLIAAVPFLSQGIKMKVAGLERIPLEELSEREKEDLEQSKELVKPVGEPRKGLRDFVIIAVLCILFATALWIYLSFRYSEELKTIWSIMGQ